MRTARPGSGGVGADGHDEVGVGAAGKAALTQHIQRRASGPPTGAADEAMAAVAGSTGAALPTAPRDRFEASLGTELGDVRVHTGAASAAAADQLGARAFATGGDIHFGAGEYRPEDPFGLHLLAHEVSHTVQQRGGGGGGVQPKLAVSEPADPLEREADVAADAMVRGAPAAVSAAGPALQRDMKADVGAVKSKEIEGAQGQERQDWPGVAARVKNRTKQIDEHLSGKTGKNDAAAAAALTAMKTRWDGTPVSDAGFDPVTGALDAKALRALIVADQADAAKLVAQKYADLVEWVAKLAKTLEAFLALRQRLGEEATEFKRFDDDFVDPDVTKALASVPGNFRPADLKAMLAQETGDFTDTSIAGLEGKSKGIVQKLPSNPSHVGVGQINTDADNDARTMAAELGITLPAKTAKVDPRKDPASGIKIAASYVAYIGEKLDGGLPAGRPTDAVELRKLVLAGYNGGPFGLIAAAKAIGGKYTWAKISASQDAMSHFAKPGEVRAYVERVTGRAP